jgi:hypothetical protein
MTHVHRLIAGGALGFSLVFFVLAAPFSEAHKGITSNYAYNEHVFPILRDRCGSCHFAGGPAPMSLVEYTDAVPWAESIREQLIAQKMPPWYVDPRGPAVKGGHTIPTRELDILLNWVAGGTPRANEKTFTLSAPAGATSPSYEGPPRQWTHGPPDLQLEMDAEHALGPGTLEDQQRFTLSTSLAHSRWLKAVDLLPGARSMVRDAIVSLEGGQMLAAWAPGYQAIAAPSGAAFLLPAGAKLTLAIHYKKNWQDEQETKADRSTVGLYFTDAPLSGRGIQTLVIDGEATTGEPRRFSATLPSGGRVLALSPSLDQAYESIVFQAVTAGGRKATLLKLRSAQPQWYRRYWLDEPIELAAGTTIEVIARPAAADEFDIPVAKRYPLQVGIDYVAQ